MATRDREEREIPDNGLERIRRIRGGNRGTVTRIERESYVIIRESRDIPYDEILTKADSLINGLKEKKKYLQQLKIMETCEIEEIDNEVQESNK